MIAIPAIDLRDGACVQLVGGEYTAERIRLPDPLAVALDWEAKGFQALHVVDLDAATGRGSNRRLIERLLDRTDLTVQVGGGVRDRDDITWLIDAGATYVVVGTRALEDEAWLAEMADDFPDQLIVAADVRDRTIVTRGWAKTLHVDIAEAMERLSSLPLAGVLVTAVHKEGLLQGADLALMESVTESTALPVIASGGITTDTDLRLLDDCGVAAAVLGMALYTGALDARAIAGEFCA
ncbi:MAG: 1-(5-phosphoribosyl)-5-[(5-phosphoribosylamino)methylideneamino] imidazole-4-carboxamide isomerase [Gemmatimonadaceae bacterium]|nr:1-(5-phosphoribosyl)-5-[(5-phosphoribosylamino)methylideneamino] imidazole-4-carboxamide isomerase [Gemmatimonadaceae bacterium]